MLLRVGLALGAVVLLTVGLAAPSFAETREDLGRTDRDERPIVVAVDLLKPGRHNGLLETDLSVNAVDTSGLARYEYRWNGDTTGRVQPMSVADPTISYATAEPNSSFDLEFRAVDVYGHRSEWVTAWSGITPSVPQVIVAGDSIASGYTRTWFTGDATCRDETLSYGSTLVRGISAGLPTSWAPEYVNIAWAGAGARAVLDGGSDSCGTKHRSQVDQIEELADEDSWTVVVVTAGINSTNWTDVVVELTKDTALSVTKDGDRKACHLALKDDWNISDRAPAIEGSVRGVVERLAVGTNASIFWTGYYDVTGTELAPLWSPIGSECSNQMSEATDALHQAIRAGLTEEVTWVDVDSDIRTQTWAGWPHPNADGHDTIGRAIAEAVIG